MSIVMTGVKKGDFVLEIIDAIDKLIFTLDMSMDENRHYNLNVNALPVGVYTVKFLAKNFERTYIVNVSDF